MQNPPAQSAKPDIDTQDQRLSELNTQQDRQIQTGQGARAIQVPSEEHSPWIGEIRNNSQALQIALNRRIPKPRPCKVRHYPCDQEVGNEGCPCSRPDFCKQV